MKKLNIEQKRWVEKYARYARKTVLGMIKRGKFRADPDAISIAYEALCLAALTVDTELSADKQRGYINTAIRNAMVTQSAGAQGIPLHVPAVPLAIMRAEDNIPRSNPIVSVLGADDIDSVSEESIAAEGWTPEECAMIKEEVQSWLDSLTIREYDIVTRRWGIGCTPQEVSEIASVKGLTRQAIDSVYQRAVEKLGGTK